MSMTVTQANAANVVARALLHVPAAYPFDRSPDATCTDPPDESEVRDALEQLLDGAYRRLGAGMGAASVERYALRTIEVAR